jgi:hypothetical protein
MHRNAGHSRSCIHEDAVATFGNPKGRRRFMKSGWIAALSIGLLIVGSLTWAGGPVGPGPTILKPIPTPTIPGIRPTIPPVVKECRDPAAFSLKYKVVAKDPKWPTTQGRIRIEGVVKNVGNAVFESDPRQASAQLYETPASGPASVKAKQDIPRLDPGATIMLHYETAWNTATEFPPKYVLQLTYDPDIYIDANPKNDDCNRNNNRMELTGQQINTSWPK